MPEFRFISKEPINRGWSKDKKYCVTDENGIRYLLRISSIAQVGVKEHEFKMMHKLSHWVSLCASRLNSVSVTKECIQFKVGLMVKMQRKSSPPFLIQKRMCMDMKPVRH